RLRNRSWHSCFVLGLSTEKAMYGDTVAGRCRHRGGRLVRREKLSGGFTRRRSIFGFREERALGVVLFTVEVPVAPTAGAQGPMSSCLDNPAVLHYQDLVGIPDSGKAVGDHKGGAAAHEMREAGLDQ